ncbi:MAG TPA: hydantoinase B/oxoprolinase family protein [Candidatus Dormibacteraeota bacterium]|nr:hydantoinase B/oxoprolinase family protein [Candidatus Dormibacteraeota bacterium]
MIKTVDPVTVEIIRNALNSAADEMGVNLARSAYTPIIYEIKDYSVALFDDECRLLGQAPGLPIFLGALEDAVKVTVRKYGKESMAERDVYLVNDSYEVGSHLNDISLFTPVFFRKKLVGYAAAKAHWIDIGAMEPSQTMASTEIYQEGYRIPPTRIMRKGRLNQELLDFFMINSRMPRSIHGDFYAMVAACRTGEQRLQDILERFGTNHFGAAVTEIFEQCERLDREVVGALPSGEWEAEGFMDSDGTHFDVPVKVKLKVKIEGSDIYLDLTGSSPQTGGCLNSGLSQTWSAARLAFKFLINPDVPPTGGTFRNLHLYAPPRSIFAAEEPAACQYYYPHAGLMIDLFIKLMAGVMPDLVTGAQCADPMNVMFDGIHSDTGETWVTGEAVALGWGASRDQDGENGLANYGGGDLKNYPAEVMESKYPIRVLEYALAQDSGGAGRRRGGLAIHREFETLADQLNCSLWLERSVTGPWGIFGGRQGGTPKVEVERPGREVITRLKASHIVCPEETQIRVTTGGGGGYGDPRERERQLVEDDIADGYISERAAKELYGYER